MRIRPATPEEIQNSEMNEAHAEAITNVISRRMKERGIKKMPPFHPKTGRPLARGMVAEPPLNKSGPTKEDV